ncbi:MAG: carboxypeptidase-like regulatory domain-containing protein [Bacteroidota bacterium]
MTKKRVQFLKNAFLQLVLFSVVLCSTVFAGGGKLTGKVMNSKTGEPLMGANIILTHIMQNGKEVSVQVPLGATSDMDGYYVILNIPVGEYTVKTSSIGYASLVTKGVKVDPDRTINMNFQLDESSINMDEVVVRAKREVIKADVSGTQEMINSDKLEELPIVRVDEFFNMLKGVQLSSSEEGYGLKIRGGSIRETDIRMDGISLQDPRSGNSYMGFNSTTINEIQVITGGFEAKYGGIRSGLLDVKTKEGSRERFTATLKSDFTPKGQYHFFGDNPYSKIYEVYAGKYAWTGSEKATDVPLDLRDFKGWGKVISPTAMKAIDSVQRYELWKEQHPMFPVADKPDFNIEGTFTGPFIIPNTTFLAGFKYENSQFAYQLGPRDSYREWNTQLKLTSTFEKAKISVNGMYAKVYSNTSGQSISYDASQRFAYMNNNSKDGIDRQTDMISGTGLLSIFNKSRLQKFDQIFAMGGAKFSYVPTPKLFYNIEFQMGYTGQDISPMLMDMNADSTQNYIKVYSKAAKKNYWFYRPTTGLPDGTTNLMPDGMGKFYMYGGGQWADSSYSYSYQLKSDMTWQANPFNEVQAGISVNVQDIHVYAGSWNQSNLAFTPNSWQYYNDTPLEIGLYIQDKLEFEGLILNAGLRVDYFNSMRDGYAAGFPTDKDYNKLYTEIYSNLGGTYNSYERWLLFRELLDNPPGWPSQETDAQIKLSPRLGVAYPITVNSKMYFNYGTFYQRPSSSILYNMKLNSTATTIPTPDLVMAKTVQYEFGYEQVFLENFLFNTTAYYKDVSDEPLARTFMDYNETNQITKYYPDAYKDIRGIELRLERNSGRFVTFSAVYDYMIVSEGTAGFSTVYENLVKYRENKLRSADQTNPVPKPRANINLNLHTPHDFGMLLGDWFTNIFFEWKSGGQYLLNSDQPVKNLQEWIDVVNFWNIDLRVSKLVDFSYGNVELSLTVKNLTNNKWLSTDNFTNTEREEYKAQLREKGGKWGEYKPEHLAKVFENSWDNILFQNPRRIILGARINL